MTLREQRVMLAWSMLVGAQAFISEFSFELIASPGSTVDSACQALEAALLFLPIGLVALRSSAIGVRILQRPFLSGTLWIAWGFVTLIWTVMPTDTMIVMLSSLGLWVTAAWFVWQFGFRRFARVYVISTTLFFFTGLIYDLSKAAEDGLIRRYQGISVHATNLGRLAMVTALICVLLILERAYRDWITWVALVLSILTMVATGTRTALGVFVVALLLIAYRRLGFTRFAALAVIAISAVAISNLFIDDATQLVSRDEGQQEIANFHGRTDIWDSALDAIQERPLLGHGVASGPQVLGLANSRGELFLQAGHAHNLALELLMSEGIIGLVLFIIALVSYFSVRPTPRDRWLSMLLIAILLGGVTEAIFNRSTALLMILAALFAQRGARHREDWNDDDPRAVDDRHDRSHASVLGV